MNRSPARVVLVGTRGYGARHLAALADFHEEGRISLAALVDREFNDGGSLGVPRYTDLDRAIDEVGADTVVIATPPHTHFSLARIALAAGTSLYLEKPPVPRVRELDELAQLARATRVEVGFQQARMNIAALEASLKRHDIGEIHRITVSAVLQRPESYFTRASWAGAWYLGDRPVFDGPLFNPCAHILHAGLLICDRLSPGWLPQRAEAECYSIRGLGGDDVTAIRLTHAPGRPILLAAATTAGDGVIEPQITVHGSGGQVNIRHRDAASRVMLATGEIYNYPGPPLSPYGALYSAVTDPTGVPDPYLSLPAVRPFVDVVESVVTAVGTPVDISPYAVHRSEDGQEYRALPDITRDVQNLRQRGALFSQLQRPWARAPRVFLFQ